MVDYSKWKDIEISDDEDDTHPNIDTPSLFRWRHQARVERMEESKRERENLLNRKKVNEEKLQELAMRLQEDSAAENMASLKKELEDLKVEEQKLKKEEGELDSQEKKKPWNVDTIGKDGFTKTVINNAPKRKDDNELSEEERTKRMKQFIKEHEKTIKQYGMLRRFEDSKKFLQDHLYLTCEDTCNFLVLWCIDLELEEKHDLMEHVSHQCIAMQYILELSKQLDVDPRACVSSFFSKIQVADPEYKKAFDDEVGSFRERIRKRAQEKIAAAEEEERQKRLGPGGLDPVEVFETLPSELQKCFETQDIPMLQEAIAKLPEEDAKYHMKRCVDSGLWVPDAGKKSLNKETGLETSVAGESDDSSPENEYETIKLKEDAAGS